MYILRMVKFLWPVAFLLTTNVLHANGPSFVENKGQWHSDVLYRADLNGAYTYLDRTGLTVLLAEEEFYSLLHDHVQGKAERPFGKMHAVKFRFTNMDFSAAPELKSEVKSMQNYFLGNDPSRWASDVKSYKNISYREVMPGIDLRYDLQNGQVKYEFIVAPGKDPGGIGIAIDGAERLWIDGDELVVSTSVGEFRELAPFAYQRNAEGRIKTVPCIYHLEGNQLSYHFPEGYDSNLSLVIDPELAFSTFIGAQSSNFGFTASYDNEGNLYAGAITFGPLYPTTPGAFQVNFAQGNVDCAISKFNEDGTALVYSTFIGGSGNEAPHSIVVSDAGEAYVFGTTGSNNFPVTPGAYQGTYAGGNNVPTLVGFTFTTGSDMFVCKLSPAGNALMGSTYVGGSGNDGLAVNSVFDFNYGDLFRGEIVIDNAGNAYVASATNSANFPVVGGYSSTHTGNVSGVVFKLNSNLTQMLWSTYTGGNGNETAISLQLADDNSVYFAGGTTSTNLATGDASQGTLAGGADGYVAHVSADGGSLLQCTYSGTAQFDQNYFVQLDTDGFVYVIGQSLGNYPVSAGVYSNANSKQYIQKFSAELDESIWSTVVGSGSGMIDISPSAFLVSNCGQIYIAGWGGNINSAGGSTNGLPTTPDAVQASTDGSDFYIMVLSPDAEELVYGTFFGGSQSAEHVDGGTSRFDKNGTVYQAVCAGCGGNSNFPTQPGVWSQTNNSSNCNLAVFKFALSSVQSIAELDAPDQVCPGTIINFLNLSTDADNYFWNFGDGNTSLEVAPSHSYSEPGIYEVWLLAESSDGCLAPDSTSLTVEVLNAPFLEVQEPEAICPGESVQLEASGAETYSWAPATNLNNPNIATPIFTGSVTTTLTVTATSNCGTQSFEVTVIVGGSELEVSAPVSICPGQSAVISASGGTGQYSWSPADGLNDPAVPNPTASPSQSTVYTVTSTGADGCEATGGVQVTVLPPPPILESENAVLSCNGIPAQLLVEGASSYSWSPPTGLSNANINNPTAAPSGTTTYTVVGSNACGSTSLEVIVLVNSVSIQMQSDSLVCKLEPFEVSASGGLAYTWQPPEVFANPNAQSTTAHLNRSTIIKVTGYDADGCFGTVERLVALYPNPIVTAGRNRVIPYGGEVQIESNSPYPIVWEYSPYLSCLACNFPIANPAETTTFYATMTSEDGCVVRDSVTVSVEGILYIPNAFTPNGDGKNEQFKAVGLDIVEFKMEIWSRWGELVFLSNDIEQGWNGGKMGSSYFCPAGLYPYRVVARERYGNLFEMKGHVTLLR